MGLRHEDTWEKEMGKSPLVMRISKDNSLACCHVTETAFPCLLFLSSCFLLFSFLGSMFKKVGEQKKSHKDL